MATEKDVENWAKVRTAAVKRLSTATEKQLSSASIVTAIVLGAALQELAKHYPNRSVKRLCDDMDEVSELGHAMAVRRMVNQLADNLQKTGLEVKTKH